MRKGIAADPHEPEKTTFNYQKYRIEDVSKTVDRRKGNTCKVSPCRLLINDGHDYLLAFDDRVQAKSTLFMQITGSFKTQYGYCFEMRLAFLQEKRAISQKTKKDSEP